MTDYEDYVEYMRVLTEDFLPHITEHTEGQMPGLFYQVNLLRRASKDALHALLELEQGHWEGSSSSDRDR